MNENIEKFKGFADMDSLKLSYEWVIDKFSLCNLETGQHLKSPFFSSVDNVELQWYLTIYPMGVKKDDEDYISLFLYLQKITVNVKVKCKFCILDKKEKEVHFQEIESLMKLQDTGPRGLGSYRYFKRNSLNTNLLLHDKLTLRCYIEAGFGTKNLPNKIMKSYIDESRNKSIQEDLKMLLDNKTLTDITLTANGKELYAHKAILAARSPVFLAMFENNMKEKAENKIEVTDFDSEVLNEMLQYIYTGKVDNIEKHSGDLLAIADKYELKELKIKCEQYFSTCLCTMNALETLELADLHNCHKLKSHVISFIAAHREVIGTPEFEKLKDYKPDLTIDLLSTIVLQK